ncbi:hypothetical protein CYLTODRAFT_69841 [Cylindrobasidium torrendii FP15055 ss-10]|uniref:Uncharacterized protein n=1 Tax=Cylindrobasidium torrendii FP15055 ss-10 TaxID=1314674 RepID=A0A0D7BPA2_9AGAR|nr:hypothetical protein CYLTODRAFT_69841 [Cylindrobasidium torrendii FP15055 ss-10]
MMDANSSGLPPKKHKKHRDVTPLDIANDATAVLSARTISNPLPLPPQDVAFDNRHAVHNSFTTPFVPPLLLPLESTPPRPDAELHSDRKKKGPKKSKQTPEEKGEEMKAIIREGIWGTNATPAVIPHTLPRSTVDLPATSGAHAHSSLSGRARPGPQSPPTPVPPANVFSPPMLANPYLPNGVVPPIPLAMPAQQQNRVVSDPVRSMSETTPRMTKRTSPQAATAPPPPPAPPAVLPMSPPDSTGNLSGISSPQSILTDTPAVLTTSRALPTHLQEPHNPSAKTSVRTSPPQQPTTTNATPRNGTTQRTSPPSAGPSQPVQATASKPPASRRRQSIDLPAVSAPSLTASTSGERRVRFMENPAISGPQRRQPPAAARRRPQQSTDGYASDSQLDDTPRDLGDVSLSPILSPGSAMGTSVLSPGSANAPISPDVLAMSPNSEAVTGLGLDINAPALPAAWAAPTPIRNLDGFLRSFSDGQHLD